MSGATATRRKPNTCASASTRQAAPSAACGRTSSAGGSPAICIQGGVGGRYNFNERDTVTASISLNKRGNDASQNEHFSDLRTGLVARGRLPHAAAATEGDALNHEFVTGFERRFGTRRLVLSKSICATRRTTITSIPPCIYEATGDARDRRAPLLRDYVQDATTRVRNTDLSGDYSGKFGPGFPDHGRTLAADRPVGRQPLPVPRRRRPRHQAQQPVQARPGRAGRLQHL